MNQQVPLMWFATPGAVDPVTVAVEFDDQRLTYADLWAQSTACGRALRARGMGAGHLVAVAMTRTPRMMSTVLGILQSGAAYLPLDLSHPDERLRYMLEDSGASLLVTDLPGAVHSPVPVLHGGDLLRASAEAPPSPIPPIDPEGLAYVIYTSGSTGRPKGVEIRHAALTNLLQAMLRVPGLSASDRVLAHTTLCFDISVVELWAPLVAGATVVLVDRDVAVDGHRLAATLRSRHVTLLQATPTTWSMLLQSGWCNGAGLKALSGGEPLARDIAAAIRRTGADLWNMYGPTETTVWSSVSHIVDDGPITIGTPIDGTHLYVVETGEQGHAGRLARVAPGGSGEICIGGIGVARGYRNRPDLTAERFVPDPFRNDGVSRMFRTGDRARVLAAGGIECLGRFDDQVKTDGYRIEPGEIEAVLRAVPGVEAVAVTAVEFKPGDRRLVAYVAGASAASTADLRLAAAAALPPYMIPSAFVHLPALPLTSGGKIDRASLPAPDWRERPIRGWPVPPRTTLERQLVDLWQEVLGVATVGIHDNFFEIGGRSRLAAYLFALIAERFGRILPLATLFETPTVARLAAILEAPPSPAEWAPLVRVRTGDAAGAGRPFFCVHPSDGHALIYRDLARRLGSDAALYCLQAVGLDGRQAALETVNAMAARYLPEIRSVQPGGPYFLGGFSFGGLIALEIARLLLAAGEPVALLALLDTEFPPAAAPRVIRTLARMRVFRTHVYPRLLQVRGHRATLARLGPRGYARMVKAKVTGKHVPPPPAADVRDVDLGDLPPLDRPDPFSRAHARVVDANFRAMELYIPQPYPGTITYFEAGDATVERDQRRLWAATARELVVHVVPGDHSTVMMDSHVGAMAALLREYLRGAKPAGTFRSPVRAESRVPPSAQARAESGRSAG